MTITTYMNNDTSATNQQVFLYRDVTQIQRVCYSPLIHPIMTEYSLTWEVKSRRDRIFQALYCDLPLVIKVRPEEFDAIYDYYQDPLARSCTHISRQEFIDHEYDYSFVEILRGKWFFRTLTVPSAVRPDTSYFYSENTHKAVNDMWSVEDETPIFDLLERDLMVSMPIREDNIVGWTIEEPPIPGSQSENISEAVRTAVPQAFGDYFPPQEERMEWKTLLGSLVTTLDSTNQNANDIVNMAGIASMQVKSLNDTFKEMLGKLPDDEFKRSLNTLVSKMSATAEQVSNLSQGVEKAFKPHVEEQKKTGFDMFDNAVRELGDKSIFLFFSSLLMHIRYNNVFTFTSVIGVAIVMYLQGKHKAWLITQIGVLVMLFPQTTFKSKKNKDTNPKVYTTSGWNKYTDVYETEEGEMRTNVSTAEYERVNTVSAVPQMMNEDELSGAFSIFTTMFLGFFAKGEAISDKMLHFFTNFKRVDGGVAEFGKLIKNMLEWLATKVRNIYLGSSDLPSVRFFQTHNEEYEKFTTEVRRFCKGYNDKSIAPTHTNLCKLASLLVVGETLLRKMPRDPISRDIVKLLTSDINSLKMIRTHFERVNITTTGFRQEPASLMFFGGPGTGKSKAVNDASYAAIARVLPEDELEDFKNNPASRIYNRAAEMVYWDGYLYQNIVCTFDDFGQAKDVAGQPDNEYMNFIRAVNGFEYNLHMAGLEQKGTTTFQSKFVIASTNLTSLDPQSVISSGAIWRRVDLKYIVVPRREYLTEETKNLGYFEQKLDPTTLPQVEVTKPDGTKVWTSDFRPEHQWFIPCDEKLNTGFAMAETFEEVMAKWFAVYDRKEAHYLQNIVSFDRCFAEYRQKYFKTMQSETEEVSMEDIFADPDLEVKENFWDNVKKDKTVWGQSADIESDTSSVYDFGSATEFIFRDLHNMSIEDADRTYREWFNIHKNAYVHVLPLDLSMVTKTYVMERTGLTEQEVFSSINEYLFVIRNQKIPPKKRITRWYTRMDEWLWEKFPLIRTCLDPQVLTVLVGIPLAVTIVVNIVSGLFNYFFPDHQNGEPQSMNHSDRMKVNKTFSKVYKNGTMKEHARSMLKTVTPQMSCDPNGRNLMKSLAQKYVWEVAVQNDKDEWVYKGMVLHLGDEDLLLPNHYLGSFFHNMLMDPNEANSKLRFLRTTSRNAQMIHICTKADLIAAQSTGSLPQEKDLVVCRVQGFPKAASILKYIVTNDDLKKDRDMMEAGLFGHRQSTFFTARWKDTPLLVSQKKWDVDWTIRQYYEYTAHTEDGDCGAIFAKMDNRETQRKIYGMHTAGNVESRIGFASAFTLEEIQAEIATLDADSTAVPQGIEVDFKHIDTIAELPRKLVPSLCLKNNIIRSRVYDCTILAKTAPAVLRPVLRDGIYVDPMQKAYAKYDIEHMKFTDRQKEILVNAVGQIFDHQLNVSLIVKTPRVFTVKEALYGTEESDGLFAIAANTSAGWPLNLPGWKNVKKLLYPPDPSNPVYVLNLQLFEEEIEALIEAYIRGERPEWYYVDVLKIERRLLEKILDVKSRMFSAGPFPLLVLFRMYFGHFDVVYKQNRITNWSTVGVNPYSIDWEALARHLCKFDPPRKALVGAGDYSSFDCTHNPFIHDLIVDHINRYFYSNGLDEDHRIRTMLFKEISNSKHIVNGVQVQWNGGMPSGNSLTIIINNFYNKTGFAYCYIRILEDNPQIPLSPNDFAENVVLAVNGDDNGFSVHPELREFMNELTLPKYMAEIGLIYTTELKSTATQKFRTLEEITFLKRTWTYDPYACRYIAPLDLDTTLEICYWTKDTSDWLQISTSNVVETLSELSLHPKEVWDKYAPKIIAAAQRAYPGVQYTSPITLPWYKRREKTLKLVSFF